MIISIIAAVGKNGELGNEGDLPWGNLSDDKKMFREKTKRHTVIMGRETHDSIGIPLPDRVNIVLTRNTKYQAEGCIVANSLEEAFAAIPETENEVFIIGGGEIYTQTLQLADRIYLTRVDGEFPADTFFPLVEWGEWQIVSEVSGHKKEQEPNFSFLVYERKNY